MKKKRMDDKTIHEKKMMKNEKHINIYDEQNKRALFFQTQQH